ncbi:hypothetical protein M885DRAFT_523828 [Pelagophyceae sp. CCMP2097]|nr:hypothetical protein M885DRAFT_523828 [Pelagophyceae sp. CCMP2097]
MALQRLTITAAAGETGGKKQFSSAAATKTDTALKSMKQVSKAKETQTAKKMKGGDGDTPERDEEFAESYEFPPNFNLHILQDDEYTKEGFVSALTSVIQGMKPKRAEECYAKLQTDAEVFVCLSHRERAEFYAEQLARKSPMIFAEAREALTGEANGAEKKYKSSRN